MENRGYRIFVEAFSVLTGVSFLASAVLHVVVFWFWDLDFTAIGAVEDVILGGIRFLLFASVVAYLLIALLMLTQMFGLESRRQDPDRSLRRAAIGILVVAFVAMAGVIGYASWERGIGFFAASRDMWAQPVLIVAPAATLALALYRIGKPALFQEVRGDLLELKGFIIVVTLVGTLAITVMGFARDGEQSNLRIAGGLALPAPCAQTPVPTVRWLGSRAMVVECGPRLFVLMHAEEPLMLEALAR